MKITLGRKDQGREIEVQLGSETFLIFEQGIEGNKGHFSD
jgi:hypothetical protein